MKLLSTGEFAAKVGLSARQIERLIHSGAITAFKVSKWWCIPEDQLQSPEFKNRRIPGRPLSIEA